MMNLFRYCIVTLGVVFAVCAPVLFGIALYEQSQKEATELSVTHPETAVEIWTDNETGYRFAVAKHRWKDGVGICLIPNFRKEADEEHIGVPQPRILDSRADTSFERK